MGRDTAAPLKYKVFFTKRCERRYDRLQSSDQRQVGLVIDRLSADPKVGYPLKDPVLRDLYSIHAGDFRIIYKFIEDPDEIELWAIEQRERVYEEIKRYRQVVLAAQERAR